jgi:hypothetical protein
MKVPAAGPPKKMKMARTNLEWVAQVSLLRPGCSGRTDFSGETRSQKRDLGHPLKVWRLQLDFRRSAAKWRDLRFSRPLVEMFFDRA